MSVIIRPYLTGEEEYVAVAHERIYSEEYHWGREFSDYAMKIARDFAAHSHKDDEEMWIAEADGVPCGCVMLCRADEPDTLQLRLFIVEKSLRRNGIGMELINTLMRRVESTDCKKLILWTASPLTDAISLYKRFGFTETEHSANTLWSLDGETVYEIKMELQLPRK